MSGPRLLSWPRPAERKAPPSEADTMAHVLPSPFTASLSATSSPQRRSCTAMSSLGTRAAVVGAGRSYLGDSALPTRTHSSHKGSPDWQARRLTVECSRKKSGQMKRMGLQQPPAARAEMPQMPDVKEGEASFVIFIKSAKVCHPCTSSITRSAPGAATAHAGLTTVRWPRRRHTHSDRVGTFACLQINAEPSMVSYDHDQWWDGCGDDDQGNEE